MSAQQQILPLTGMGKPDTGHYRGDHLLVAEMVERGSKVLDVGCGDGDLLQLLESRGIDGRGIELSREGVNHCVAKGLGRHGRRSPHRRLDPDGWQRGLPHPG
jgi:SAM-dependent methyltransferase